MSPFAEEWEQLAQGLLGPLRPGYQLAHPVTSLVMARFGLQALRSVRSLAEGHFSGELRPRPLGRPRRSRHAASRTADERGCRAACWARSGTLSAGPWLAGARGALPRRWPPICVALGGEIVTGTPIESLEALPQARATLLDVTPRQVLKLAGDRLPASYQRELERFRYGVGVFKIDYALSDPVPWKAEACRHAGTVHVGGTMAEIASAERAVWRGVPPEEPLVLVAQQSLFDGERAPSGRQVLWAYSHAPSGG